MGGGDGTKKKQISGGGDDFFEYLGGWGMNISQVADATTY